MAEATIDALGIRPLLVPIYCTAEIPSTLIDTLVRRTYTFFPPHLYVVDDADRATNDFDSCSWAKPPTAPFTSPFLNYTLQQITEHFDALPDEDNFFSQHTFIILDERTLRDETCLIVSVIPERGSTDISCARADFYVAALCLLGAEMRTHRLCEGIESTWREDGGVGQVLFTKERMAEMLGGEDKLQNKTSMRHGGESGEWPERVEDV